jgi:hypothetical protein
MACVLSRESCLERVLSRELDNALPDPQYGRRLLEQVPEEELASIQHDSTT